MMVALLLLVIFHPGRFLVGPDSEFPKLSRAEKKQLKAERKAAKKNSKYAHLSDTDGAEISLGSVAAQENTFYGDGGNVPQTYGNGGQYHA